MEIWIWFLVISIIAVVIEIFIPTMFCINFAFAGIVTAIVSIFWSVGFIKLLILFCILSLISLVFIRPVLAKILKKGNTSDFYDQYMGKIVKCIEPITTQEGAVTVYDERWDARLLEDGEPIPVGTEVKIVKHDSIILYVVRI